MDENQALETFAGDDDDAARQTLDQLRSLYDRYVKGCLHHWGCHPNDIEDVTQDVFIKVWESRFGFSNKGVKAWQSWLYKISRHCLIDFWRNKPLDEAEELLEDEELPDPDANPDPLDAELLEIYHRANVLWLELDRRLSRDAHQRQLLAAQYFYLEGATWEEVLTLLGDAPSDEPPLTGDVLDGWLSHPGVVRFLAYQELYYSNHCLADDLLNQSDTNWTDAEKTFINWRYRFALLMEQILNRKDCPFRCREDLQPLLDRLTLCLPFHSQMVKVLGGLQRAPNVNALAALGKPGLWQRLALQYCYHDELPHRDIRERTEPAANRVHYSVTEGNLNMWLSGERLLKRLIKFCRDAEGGEEDV